MEIKCYEKYIFLVDNTVICIEEDNKKRAIELFKDLYLTYYNMDWEIKRIYSEINIKGETIRY